MIKTEVPNPCNSPHSTPFFPVRCTQPRSTMQPQCAVCHVLFCTCFSFLLFPWLQTFPMPAVASLFFLKVDRWNNICLLSQQRLDRQAIPHHESFHGFCFLKKIKYPNNNKTNNPTIVYLEHSLVIPCWKNSVLRVCKTFQT